jgi:hypothetical protein
MNHRRTMLLFLAIAWMPRATSGAEARRAATLSATQLDDDFFLQGEYAGPAISADGALSPTGVQVIALGDGKFQAVEYAGGLPGNGWDMRTRWKYSGMKKSANLAELEGNGRRLLVRRGSVFVKDAAGRIRGRLAKIQRSSQTLRLPPPPGSKVLFYGRDARQFTSGDVTSDHLLVAGADTNQSFGDCTLHLEFRTPYMPRAREQQRGNSGVYIQGRYEVQILDSFGLDGADNECGGLYKQRAPLLNMCLPPLAWQTYDIDFFAPRYDASGGKRRNARVTIRLNGIVVQNGVELIAKTGAGAPEGPDPRPLRLQDHGDPVHFRNLWIAEHNEAAAWRDCASKLCLPASSCRLVATPARP